MIRAGLPDGTRVRISGTPLADAEVVALLLALDRAAAARRTSQAAPPRQPGWQRAARLEGLGWAQVMGPTDLVYPRTV